MKYLPAFAFAVLTSLASATAALAQGTGWDLTEAERAAGKVVFQNHCAACHTVKPGLFAALGPSLKGIAGRTAGTAPGFPYSEALKKSGIVWTDENLRKWIAEGSKMVPGTLMPHVTITDPVELVYVVEYLRTLGAPAKP